MAAASPKSLWKIAKWACNREHQPPSVTLIIKCLSTSEEAVKPKEKTALLKETFFPHPPEVDLSDIENARYDD